MVGDRVGDDVPFGADPAGGAREGDEGLESWVGFHDVAVKHDSVGGGAGVDYGGCGGDLGEERDARVGFDAVGGEEDVGCDGVGV